MWDRRSAYSPGISMGNTEGFQEMQALLPSRLRAADDTGYEMGTAECLPPDLTDPIWSPERL